MDQEGQGLRIWLKMINPELVENLIVVGMPLLFVARRVVLGASFSS
jgi:hypothetical protein